VLRTELLNTEGQLICTDGPVGNPTSPRGSMDVARARRLYVFLDLRSAWRLACRCAIREDEINTLDHESNVYLRIDDSHYQ